MNALKTSTLRPGILVSLKTSISGNISYESRVIEPEHLTDAGAELARWETARTVADPAEMEAAKKARGDACTVIRKECVATAFGLLCPESRQDVLAAAIAEGRRLADEFNATSKLTNLGVYVLCGRVAQDDAEAVRSINSEVRDLLSAMESGVGNLDAGAVRAAASKAKSIGEMLSPGARQEVMDAVMIARAAARKITKAGEQAAQEIDREAIAKIASARTSFLDLEPAAEVAAPVVEEARELDLAPGEDPDAVHAQTVAAHEREQEEYENENEVGAPKAAVPALELE